MLKLLTCLIGINLINKKYYSNNTEKILDINLLLEKYGKIFLNTIKNQENFKKDLIISFSNKENFKGFIIFINPSFDNNPYKISIYFNQYGLFFIKTPEKVDTPEETLTIKEIENIINNLKKISGNHKNLIKLLITIKKKIFIKKFFGGYDFEKIDGPLLEEIFKDFIEYNK